MRTKTYPCNVIRIRKGKKGPVRTHQMIAILNTKKTSSQHVKQRFGYYVNSSIKFFSINYENLALYLNKGFKMNDLTKKYISNYGLGVSKLFKQKQRHLNKSFNLKKLFDFKKQYYLNKLKNVHRK